MLDTATPEQVIAVPKISQDSIPQRTVLRSAQMAEQLVELPTFAVFVEQTVDIPVQVGGADFRGDLHGFLPVQGSPAFCGAQHLAQHSFLPEQGSLAFGGAQHLAQHSFLQNRVL